MLIGDADTRVGGCHELAEVLDVLQLGTATGEDDTGDEFLVVAGELDLIVHLLHNHLGASVDDAGEGLDIYLARSLAADARDGDDIVFADSLDEARAKLDLETLGLAFKNIATFADVIGDGVACQRQDRGMADYAVVEDGDISGTAANVDHRYTGVTVTVVEDSLGRGHGLEDHALNL